VDPAARFGGLALLSIKGAADEPEDPKDEEKFLFKGKCKHRGEDIPWKMKKRRDRRGRR
jgi:hypothetical protein